MNRILNSKFLFKIYYFGNRKYYGSQRQPYFVTIEQCLLDVLKKKCYIHNFSDSEFEFASRTDRFVSARGACFSCNVEKEPILMEINSALPKDIGIWAYAEIPMDFSPRHDAILRHYVYIVPTSISYLQRSYNINLEIMKKACKQLEGCHDFANFSKRKTDEINTIRDMDSVILSIQNDYLIFQFKSRSFLRQQIRRMVKKILELGKNEILYNEFLDLFDSSKMISYQPADPKGLILWDIEYDKNVIFIEDPISIKRMYSFFLKKELNYSLKHYLFRVLQQDDFS
ncbi:MAG: tRNA pseudouridine synthase A [Promethearchaeota archaeon]